MNLPISLNEVAAQWKRHLENLKITSTIDDSQHVRGARSVYLLTITFKKSDKDVKAYYAGQTGDPRKRLACHKSEIKNCKSTTFVGKSALYCNEYFQDASEIHVSLKVLFGGMTLEQAYGGEAVLSARLIEENGPVHVLTRPHKLRIS